MNWLLVALGGALGSMVRYGVGLAFPLEPGRWPWATFTVNLVGCLLIGGLWALNERFSVLTPAMRQLLMIGFLGGFTTFSAFGLEALTMWRNGQTGMMLVYLFTSSSLGIVSALLGYKCVGWFA